MIDDIEPQRDAERGSRRALRAPALVCKGPRHAPPLTYLHTSARSVSTVDSVNYTNLHIILILKLKYIKIRLVFI